MIGHTPEPWTLIHVEGVDTGMQRFEIRGMFGDNAATYPVFNKNLSTIDGTTVCMKPKDARRIVACVNALATIPDPEAYMKAARALARLATRASSWHWFDTVDDGEFGDRDDLFAALDTALEAFRASQGEQA